MKRELIISLLFLLIIPLVSSTIHILGPEKDTYNIGDEITISGYIYEEESFTGFLSLILNCHNTTYQLPKSSVSINEGERKNFPEDFALPKITTSSSMEGTCYIEASLLDTSNSIKETTTSDTFETSKDLIGKFNIDQTKVQVGKTIKITGTVKKLNNEPTDGSIEVYFKRNDTKYLADISSFKDGTINFEYQPIATPAGTYSVDFLINDIYGNKKLFQDIVSFTLVDEIYVTARADKSSALPGNQLKISGEAKTILQEEVSSGNVRVELAGNIYKAKIKNSKFDYELVIPNDIKTGKHTIIIKVDDKFGNKGYTDTIIYINPIATIMEIKLDKSTYRPSEKMEIQPILYDQANDELNEMVKLEIFHDNEIIESKDLKTSEKLSLELSEYVPPGEYTIRASSKGVVKETQFAVEAISQLDASLNNNTLEIINIGNIRYKQPITLNFDDGKFLITKRDTLEPKESLIIDLTKQVPSGKYKLIVSSGDFEKEFDDIKIIGKSERSFDIIYYILIIIFIGIILFNVFTKSKKSKIIRYEYNKGRKEGKAILEKIKKTKTQQKKEFKFNPPKTETERKKHIEDFRRRMLKEIKETQEKEKKIINDKRGSFIPRPVPERKISAEKEKPSDKEGMFNMFN